MIIGSPLNLLWIVLPFVGYRIGAWFDDKETERMTYFRDKSALYGGQQRKDSSGKPIPSWP